MYEDGIRAAGDPSAVMISLSMHTAYVAAPLQDFHAPRYDVHTLSRNVYM